MWQGKGIGYLIEIISHFQVRIIDHVISAIGLPVAHGSNTGRSQISGVNVVGEYVVSADQRRHALFEPFQRQAIRRINTWSAQDANSHTVTCAPGAQSLFSIDTTPSTRAFGVESPCFIDNGTATIAINPGGANVNQAAW